MLLGMAILTWPTPEAALPTKARFVSLGQTPLHFEPRGETAGVPSGEKDATFVARGPGYSLQVGASGMAMHLRAGIDEPSVPLHLSIVGADAAAQGTGLERLPGESNYYLGNDPAAWRTDVPHFAKVRFDDVYPGIDVVYYDAAREGRSQRSRLLEYDFIVAPGADPKQIRLAFDGAEYVSIDKDGGLRLHTAAGDVRQYRPVVYQEIAEMRRPIGGRYVLRDDGAVAFEVDAYDREHPLVIDPKVEYSTYLGGSGNDQAFAIDVGPDGSIYVAGWTESPDFPAGGVKGRPGTGRDAFLTRLDGDLTTSLLQNFFGGNGNDQAFEVTVDRDGNAYITGFTDNRGFPETDGSRWAGGRDAFTAAVSPDGELLHSGTLGGLGDDTGAGIDFFPGEDFVLVVTGGPTDSLNFPLTPDAFQTQRAGPTDGWVDALRLDTTAGIPFTVDNRSTSLLGGNGTDFVDSISFSKLSLNVGFRFDENDVFVAETTNSDRAEFPGAPFPTRAGGTDGHVTVLRLDPSFEFAWGAAEEDVVAFSSYLPGGPDDESEVSFETFKGSVGGPSSKDRVYFFYNAGTNVPTFAGAAVENHPGGPQSLVMSELVFDEQTGTAEFRSTYAGGPNFDQASRMALDPNGAPAGVGLTFSQIPTTPDAVFPNLNGVFGGYFMLFSGDLTQIDYATYLWGNRNSNVTDVAFDDFGQIHATGINGPGAFTTPGSFQPDFGGDPFDATVGVITRPFVSTNTPVNAASFRSGCSPQQISAVGGANIGPEPAVIFAPDSQGLVPTDTGGVRIFVDGEESPVTFASDFQDNFIYRFSVGLRFLGAKGQDNDTALVQVEFDGELSNVVEVEVMESNPGLFALDGSGQGQGAILNPDFTINGVDNPAPSDSFSVLYGTGGGVTDPICPDGGFGPSAEPLPRLQLPQQVLVDGVDAQVPYSGSAPGLVCGVNQWNVVPTNNPTGVVPIQVCSGDTCSNIVTAVFE